MNEWDSKLVDAYQTIIQYMGRDGDLTESDKVNMADTAKRAAKAMKEMTSTRTEVKLQTKAILKTVFPMENTATFNVYEDDSDVDDVVYFEGMVAQGPIRLTSMCPHHLLPVLYEAYVAYIPDERMGVLGLSKLARIAKAVSKRPVLQEQLAKDIANTLCKNSSDSHLEWPALQSRGSIVLLTGEHSCMSLRGVHSHALTSCSVMRGEFMTNTDLEAKFHNFVNTIKSTKLR